ncbi:MAG: hypothetical protein WBF17_10025 [Phycisphaerae bacterium]
METLMETVTVVSAAAWGIARACGLLLRLVGIQPFPTAGLGIVAKLWSVRRYLALASWILTAVL